MAFNRICETCGTPFIAQGNRARYCKPCGKKQKKLLRAQYKAKKRAEKKPDNEEINFRDTPENILACLACTSKTCLLDKHDTCTLLTSKKRS